ncbi:MAG: hypothetical protein ABJB09_03375 [Verrucomicrobiota bacterium]
MPRFALLFLKGARFVLVPFLETAFLPWPALVFAIALLAVLPLEEAELVFFPARAGLPTFRTALADFEERLFEPLPFFTAFFTAAFTALFAGFTTRALALREPAARPAIAPITPPITAPTGPATLPITAPVAAPAVCFDIGGISIFSEEDEPSDLPFDC